MLTKRELKALWKEIGFRPAKRLGQNFLIDKNVAAKILAAVEISKKEAVIEIGAGFGTVTEGLAGISRRVFAVEKDKKIINALKTEVKLPGNVTPVEGDFLDAEIGDLAGDGGAVVYGNIPYYITSPIIEKLIRNIASIKKIYLVVQEELAERILSLPSSKATGRLGLYVQYHAVPKRLFKIKRDSFFPAPKVDSVLLELEPRAEKKVSVRDEALLFGIIKKTYSQRRKTLLNGLADTPDEKKNIEKALRASGVDPAARPESLSLEDFARIADVVKDGS